jgi:hypothetical protein
MDRWQAGGVINAWLFLIKVPSNTPDLTQGEEAGK